MQASLVAADAFIQPGQPFTVALHFVHDPHWHTYWLNPGTGLATTLTWKLPPGFAASDIQWPAPKVLIDHTGTVVGNGYEDELFLPVTITPPADLKPGATVELNASADWLMCEDVCMPGSADVKLSLPVSADTPKPDATWGAKIRATVAGLPRTDATWIVTATRDSKNVMLVVTPTGSAASASGGPKDLHFFSDDGLVAYELPQAVKDHGQRGFILTLPVSSDAPKDATLLHGVLTSDDGWLADGTLRGLRVDVPFSGASGPPVSGQHPALTFLRVQHATGRLPADSRARCSSLSSADSS